MFSMHFLLVVIHTVYFDSVGCNFNDLLSILPPYLQVHVAQL